MENWFCVFKHMQERQKGILADAARFRLLAGDRAKTGHEQRHKIGLALRNVLCRIGCALVAAGRYLQRQAA